MSVDQTINELSGTLAQLSMLVAQINGQIGSVTSRINQTLDNFDSAVANIAKDAGSVTYQVGDTVSQIPNSWVFYVLFITLIIVFLLLSIVLCLNLVTKVHAIYTLMRTNDGADGALIGSREDSGEFLAPSPSKDAPYITQMAPAYPPYQPPRNVDTSYQNGSQNGHISLDMEGEPRRYGARPAVTTIGGTSQPISGSTPWPDTSSRDEPSAQPRSSLYQRRQSGEGNGGGRYNVQTATAGSFNRPPQQSSSLQV